jgi:hypothetical protein
MDIQRPEYLMSNSLLEIKIFKVQMACFSCGIQLLESQTQEPSYEVNVPVIRVDAATYSTLAATSEYSHPFVGIRCHPVDLDSVSGRRENHPSYGGLVSCMSSGTSGPTRLVSLFAFCLESSCQKILCNFATCIALQSLFEWVASLGQSLNSRP